MNMYFKKWKMLFVGNEINIVFLNNRDIETIRLFYKAKAEYTTIHYLVELQSIVCPIYLTGLK